MYRYTNQIAFLSFHIVNINGQVELLFYDIVQFLHLRNKRYSLIFLAASSMFGIIIHDMQSKFFENNQQFLSLFLIVRFFLFYFQYCYKFHYNNACIFEHEYRLWFFKIYNHLFSRLLNLLNIRGLINMKNVCFFNLYYLDTQMW